MNFTSTVADRVRVRLDELSINAAEAARRAGLERTFLHDLLGGRKKTIAADALVSLADALDCTPEYLVGRSEEASRLPLGHVEISGIIEPGAWRDPHRPVGLPPLPAARLAINPGRAKAFLARGDSASRVGIVDGTVVVTEGWDGTIQPGSAYVVRRLQGLLEELTIRIARRRGDAFELILPTPDNADALATTAPDFVIVGNVAKAVTLFGNLS